MLRLAIPTGRCGSRRRGWRARRAERALPTVRALPRSTGYATACVEARDRAGERVAVDAPSRVRSRAVRRRLPTGWPVSGSAVGGDARAGGGAHGGIRRVGDPRSCPTTATSDSSRPRCATVLPAGAHRALDARQSNPDRYRAFLRCLDRRRRSSIVGNRSVVYAPAAALGLIALWDDGDPLLAEPLSPYVHARDAALMRQEQQGGALMFAVALPQHRGRAARRGRVAPSRSSPEPPVPPKVVPTAQQDGRRPAGRAGAHPVVGVAHGHARRSSTGRCSCRWRDPGYAPGLALRRLRRARALPALRGPALAAVARRAPELHVVRRPRGRLALHELRGRRRCAPSAPGATSHRRGSRPRVPGRRASIIADGERTVLAVDDPSPPS